MSASDLNGYARSGSWLNAFRAKLTQLPQSPHPSAAIIAKIARNTHDARLPYGNGKCGDTVKGRTVELGEADGAEATQRQYLGASPGIFDLGASPGIFGNSGNFGTPSMGDTETEGGGRVSSTFSRDSRAAIPLPNSPEALALIAQIPDQASLWCVVDVWERPRRSLTREANRVLSAALQERWEAIAGVPFDGKVRLGDSP